MLSNVLKVYYTHLTDEETEAHGTGRNSKPGLLRLFPVRMAESASDCVALGKSYHLPGLGFTIGLREGGVDRYLLNGVL